MKTLECDITFSRAYASRHLGAVYGAEYFSSIHHRVETDRRVARGVWERFGEIGLGKENPAPTARLGYDDTLNVSLLFAGPGALRIASDYSWIEPVFSIEDCGAVRAPADISACWPHTVFLSQYEEAIRAWGAGCVVPPGVHGILETALDLRGTEFLVDMVSEERTAGRFLDVLSDTVIGVKEFWDRTVYGEQRPGLSLGSCSTTMLSPELVRKLLLPRYQRIASHFGKAFLCSCGNSTANLSNFAELRDAPFVRNGWKTDFRQTARILKHKHVKAGLDVVRAAGLAAAELRADVRSLLAALGPVDRVSVLLINAGSETPDENVRAIVHEILAFAREMGVALSGGGACNLPAAELNRQI